MFFLPFILVSMESILRTLVYLPKDGVQPTAASILNVLLSRRSPLSSVKSDIKFWVYEKKTDSSYEFKCIFDDEDRWNEVKQYFQEQGVNSENLVYKSFDREGYKNSYKSVLEEIRDKYYSRKPESKYLYLRNNTYRNIILHANKPLLIEDETMFETILRDYYKLIKGKWGDPIMPYHKDHPKNGHQLFPYS